MKYPIYQVIARIALSILIGTTVSCAHGLDIKGVVAKIPFNKQVLIAGSGFSMVTARAYYEYYKASRLNPALCEDGFFRFYGNLLKEATQAPLEHNVVVGIAVGTYLALGVELLYENHVIFKGLKDKDEKIVQLNSDISHFTATVKPLQDDITKLNGDLAKEKAEVVRLTDLLKNTPGAVGTLEEKKDRLEQELVQHKNQIATLVQEKAKLEQACEQGRLQAQTAVKKYEELIKKYSDKQKAKVEISKNESPRGFERFSVSPPQGGALNLDSDSE